MRWIVMLLVIVAAGCAASRPTVRVEIHAEDVRQSPDYTISVTL